METKTWRHVAGAALVAAATSASRPAEEPSREGRELTFRADRVYEVTGIWVKEGRMPELNAYFGEVFPIAAADFGVRPLFSLEPIGTYAGDFLPDVMFVNEWPSLDHFRRFTSDPRARALFPARDAAVSRLVVTQYTVPADVSVTLREGDVVEFAAMWVKAGAGNALSDYYRRAVEVARRHGLQPLTPLAAAYSYKGDFFPDRAALNLWVEKERFDGFAAEAAPLFPQRDAALERLEVTHARVRFESAR